MRRCAARFARAAGCADSNPSGAVRARAFRDLDQPMSRPSTPLAAALTAFLASLLLYLLTLCPTVYVAGTGENATAAATLGVPHPPGFPLFCLLGRLAVLAAPAAPARAVNGLVALAGALAAGVLAWLVARLARRPAAGAAAGLLFALSRTVWGQATIAEVYTLSALLMALELTLVLAARGDLGGSAPGGAGRRGRGAGEPAFLLFTFVLGLGLCLHPMHALLLPGYALLLATAPRRVRPRALLAGAGLLALGFSLHLYAPLRSHHDPVLDWGDPERLAAWVEYLTAAQYRGHMFSLGPAEIGVNLTRAGRILLAEWGPVVLLLVPAGAVVLARRRPALGAALGLMALADLVFAINYDIPWEIEVYYIPFVLVAAVSSGVALAALCARARVAGVAACAAVVLWPAIANFAPSDLRRADLVDRYGRDILDSLPPRAALVTPPANPTFILLYLTAVEGARPDVQVYVAEKAGLAPLGAALKPGAATVTPWMLAADRGRPVHFAERDPLDDLPGYRLAPAGAVYRLAGAGEPAGAAAPGLPLRVDPARDVRRTDDFHLRLIGARYFLLRADSALAAGDTAVAHAALAGARDLAGDLVAVEGWIAGALAAAGDRAGAIAAYGRALALEEDPAFVNRRGRLELEAGDLAAAEASFRRAIALDDRLAIAHSNLGALLGRRGDYAGAIRELERAVALDPASTKAHNNLGTALLLSRRQQEAAAAFRNVAGAESGATADRRHARAGRGGERGHAAVAGAIGREEA